MSEKTRSKREVVRSAVGVKLWIEKEPLPEEIRPARCPNCERASHPLGGKVWLQGHGHRSRQLRGPLEPGGAALELLIRLQRFRCLACIATCTVGPRELVTTRLYGLPAIAWALALLGVLGKSLAEVRRQVSPWRVVGPSAASSWQTPLRWLKAVRSGRLLRCVRAVPEGWSWRQVAERVATTVAAYAPPEPEPPPLEVRAFQGAAHGW